MKTDGSTDLVPISASRALRELLGKLQIGVRRPHRIATWLVPPWARDLFRALPAEDEERGLRIARDSEDHRTAMLVIAVAGGRLSANQLRAYLDAIENPIADANDPVHDRGAS